MTVFVTIMIVLFLVLIGWTWSSLGNIETKTKIICMVCGLIATYIITFIIVPLLLLFLIHHLLLDIKLDYNYYFLLRLIDIF